MNNKLSLKHHANITNGIVTPTFTRRFTLVQSSYSVIPSAIRVSTSLSRRRLPPLVKAPSRMN